MTLCIAAECEYEGQPAIAMCCDLRAQTGNIAQPELLVGTDDVYKMREFGRATLMLGGSFPRANELAIACKPVVNAFTSDSRPTSDFDLVVDDLLRSLRNAATKKKASSEESVGEGERQGWLSTRNLRSFLQVESARQNATFIFGRERRETGENVGHVKFCCNSARRSKT